MLDLYSFYVTEDLYALMNKVVKGDFRKSEFESIDNLNILALELNKYLEKTERNLI